MEISKEFAEKEMQLHKSEYEKWSKIYNSIVAPEKKRLTKKEKELIETNNLISVFHKRRKQ